MTRHSRNCTANSVYSYHERKRDAAASGYGALAARYGKDGVKDFDCCCLSLHPCKLPVITAEGYLFEREAILEYILAKKKEIKRKTKEFEKQSKKDQLELEELGAAEERSRLEKFLKSEQSSGSGALGSMAARTSTTDPEAGPSSSSSGSKTPSNLSNMRSGHAKKLPSYWIPSLTPDNKTTRVHKPDQRALCPMSGEALRLKDLVTVRFTRVDPNATFSSLEGHKERYKCPVTGDLLRNTVGCAVLRTTGDVITLEAVNLVRKDMKHPLTGAALQEKDIIVMQRGGTGYAAANEHLAGVMPRPVMQA